MAEAERRLLAREARLSGFRQILRQRIEVGLAVLTRQRGFQFKLAVEVVLDDAFVAAGDENEMLDAGFLRLVDDVLDQRTIDDGQHFLRHRLGGGKEAGAETGNR